MSEFAAAFTTWSEHHKTVSVRGLAQEAGLANGLVSNIRRGDPPTFESICKLLPAIERLSTQSEARTLLVAYLRDETPQPYKSQVRILPVDETGNLDTTDPISQALSRFERHARSDPEFARWFLTTDGYMHEADSDAVDERVRQFEAEQIASLGLAQSPGATRTLGQILAGYDLHTLSQRTGISVAELQRLQTGKDPFTAAVLKGLAPGISMEDTQALLQIPLTEPQPRSNIHQLPMSHWHMTPGERVAEDPPAKDQSSKA